MLRKLKGILEDTVEGHEDEACTRRRKVELKRQIAVVANLAMPGRTRAVFSTDVHEAIWPEINTEEDHRGCVVEWVESLIMTEVNEEFEGKKERTQA
jgi:hypothetical protein